jgi:hypothetical protein
MLLFLACAYHPPAETPALLAAAEPIVTIEQANTQVAIRAGSAYDPPGREGLAWVTAHAVAAAAGATVEVGPEIVVFSTTDPAKLAVSLAAPPTAEQVHTSAAAAAESLAASDCATLASAAWDAWVYVGHPYGHAPMGRRSVLTTLTTAEVAGFQQLRYVRSVAALGAPDTTHRAAFDALPPRLSRSPTPATIPPLPEQQVLIVRAEGQRCLLVGHPVSGGPEKASGKLHEARLDARHAAYIPLPEERDAAAVTTDALGGGWLPLWSQGPHSATPEQAAPLLDHLLGLPAYPSLAMPLRESDPTAAGWLDPARQRAVVVLDPSVPFESSSFSIVQTAITPAELFQ